MWKLKHALLSMLLLARLRFAMRCSCISYDSCNATHLSHRCVSCTISCGPPHAVACQVLLPCASLLVCSSFQGKSKIKSKSDKKQRECIRVCRRVFMLVVTRWTHQDMYICHHEKGERFTTASYATLMCLLMRVT